MKNDFGEGGIGDGRGKHKHDINNILSVEFTKNVIKKRVPHGNS